MAYNYKVYNWWYTFYLAGTDEVYCSGTKHELAEKMNISETSFHSTIAKIKIGKIRKYVVVIEDIDNGTIRCVGEENADYQHKILEEKSKRDDKLYALYQKGYTDVKIAQETGNSAEQVRKFRKEHFLPKNYSSRRKEATAFA